MSTTEDHEEITRTVVRARCKTHGFNPVEYRLLVGPVNTNDGLFGFLDDLHKRCSNAEEILLAARKADEVLK